jgi:hypothetical protein
VPSLRSAQVRGQSVKPQTRKPKPHTPQGLFMWWPLNDGFHTNDVGGTGSQKLKLGYFNTRFTSASDYGQLSCPTARMWRYDPRVGGYCYDNNAGGGGHLNSANNSEVTFVNFGAEVKTVSVWAYLTANPSTTVSPVIHKAFNFPNNYFSIWADQATSKWQLSYSSGGVVKTTSSANAFVLNRWYHLAVSYDGATRKLYVNGGLSASNAEVAAPDVNGEIWCVGNRAGNDQNFPGYIWNVMMFVGVLAPSQIRDVYLNPFDPFSDPWLPPITNTNGGPPPPPGQATVGPLVYGRPATPIAQRNTVASNHSGQKPMVE